MYHSLTFTDPNYQTKKDASPDDIRIIEHRNTWDDWHLIPTSRPTFSFPEAKTNYVEVPGSSTTIDLSETLTGYPTYKDRSGSFEFIVMNDGLTTSVSEDVGYINDSKHGWSGVYSSIANFLHGQKMYLEYEDDSGWYYIGRFTLNEWNSEESYSTITINYTVEPFKYSIVSSEDLWKWDPFNFKTGAIRTYKDLEYGTSDTSITLIGTQVPVVPTIYVSTKSILTLPNGKSYTLESGENKNPQIKINPSSQVWKIRAESGTGQVGIYFRERSI